MTSRVHSVPRRLTDDDKRRIYDAYVAAGRKNVDELVKELGTTKTTLYAIVREIERPVVVGAALHLPHTVTGEGSLVADLPDSILQAMAQTALQTLLREFVDCRNRVTELERENEKLRHIVDGQRFGHGSS